MVAKTGLLATRILGNASCGAFLGEKRQKVQILEQDVEEYDIA